MGMKEDDENEDGMNDLALLFLHRFICGVIANLHHLDAQQIA